MHIREIKRADIEELIKFGRALIDGAAAYKGIPFEADVLRTWFFGAIERPELIFCKVAESNGKLLGAMLATRGPFAFSSAHMAIEMGVFVAPEARGGAAAHGLLVAFEQWARLHGCVRAQAGDTVKKTSAVVEKLYGRLGYEDAGNIFRKELL